MTEVDKVTNKVMQQIDKHAGTARLEVLFTAMLEDINTMTTKVILESTPEKEHKEMISQLKRYKKNLNQVLQLLEKNEDKLSKLYPEEWKRPQNN